MKSIGKTTQNNSTVGRKDKEFRVYKANAYNKPICHYFAIEDGGSTPTRVH